jgi:hypothetical protein
LAQQPGLRNDPSGLDPVVKERLSATEMELYRFSLQGIIFYGPEASEECENVCKKMDKDGK